MWGGGRTAAETSQNSALALPRPWVAHLVICLPFSLQTLLPLSCNCGLKQKAWWGVLKRQSFPTVTPPDLLTASIGNADGMYPVRGVIPRAAEFLGS